VKFKVKQSPVLDLLTVRGFAATSILKSEQYIFVPNCTKVVNLAKIPSSSFSDIVFTDF